MPAINNPGPIGQAPLSDTSIRRVLTALSASAVIAIGGVTVLTVASTGTTVAGDIAATGGFRSKGLTYNVSNIAASQSDGAMTSSAVSYNLDFLPRAGSVTGIVVVCNDNAAGSAIVFDVLNSAGDHLITGALTIAAGQSSGVATFAKDAYPVAAGIGSRPVYTTDGDWTSTSVDCSAWIESEF